MIELLRKIYESIGQKNFGWTLSYHDISHLLPKMSRKETEGIARFLRRFLTIDDIFNCGDYIQTRIEDVLDGACSSTEYFKWMHEAISDDAGAVVSHWTMESDKNSVLYFDEGGCSLVTVEEATTQVVPDTDICGSPMECVQTIISLINGNFYRYPD